MRRIRHIKLITLGTIFFASLFFILVKYGSVDTHPRLLLKWKHEGVFANCKIINKELFATKIILIDGNKKIDMDLIKVNEKTGNILSEKMIFEENYETEKYIDFSSGFFKHRFRNSDILIDKNTIYATIEIGRDYDPKNFYKKFLWSVIACDLNDQQIKWRFNKEDSGTTPDVSYGNLKFVNSKKILFTALDDSMTPPKCQLYLLDEINGNIVWQAKESIGYILGKPAIYNNIYVTSQEVTKKIAGKYEYASYANSIDSNTGKSLWKVKISEDGIAQYASPQVASGRMYILTGLADTATLHCLSADNGKILWKKKVPYAERIFLYPEDKTIYIAQTGIIAYDMYTGRLKKKYLGLYGEVYQIARIDNIIINNNGSGSLEVFDKRTGRLLQMIGVLKKDIEWQLKQYDNKGIRYKLLFRKVRNLFNKPNGILETPVAKNILATNDMAYTYGDKGIFAYEIKNN